MRKCEHPNYGVVGIGGAPARHLACRAHQGNGKRGRCFHQRHAHRELERERHRLVGYGPGQRSVRI